MAVSAEEMTLEQKRAVAMASARARAAQAPVEKSLPDGWEKRMAISATRGEHPVLAGASDFLHGASGMLRGGLNLVTPSTDGKNRGVGDLLLNNPGADPNSGLALAGSLVDPVALATGTEIAKAVPYAKVLGSGGVNAAKALAKNLGAGAATGGIVGGVTDTEDRGESAGRGAVIGAALNQILPPALRGGVNLAAAGIAGARNLFFPSAGQLAVRASGERAPAVIRALETETHATPGSEINAGQASVPANSAEFAALQDLAESFDPSRHSGPMGAEGRQQAARVAAVRSVGGTPQDLEVAITKRDVAGSQNYPAAFAETVKRDKDLRDLWKNPYFKDEVGEAAKLMKAAGHKISTNMTEFLHNVKLGIDARLGSVGQPGQPALSTATQHALMDVKTRLVDWLRTHNPKYETARATHETLSEPINRMQIGQELERALSAPTGQERASSFGTTLRKLTMNENKNTGEAFIDTLKPGQRKVVEAVLSDLQRDVDFKKLASAGRQNMMERVAAPQIPPTGMFNPKISVLRGMVNRVTGGATEGKLRELSVLMERNPAALAQQMKKYTPQQRKVIAAALEQYAQYASGNVVAAEEQAQ